MTGAILLRRFQKLSCTVRGGRITGVFALTRCQSGLKCWQLANSMLRVKHRESALLGGRGSVWCRYVWVWKVVLPNMHIVLVFRTLYTLHIKLRTPFSKLYTWHSTLYTWHIAFYIPHFPLYTSQCTLDTPQPALYSAHFTHYIPHFSL